MFYAKTPDQSGLYLNHPFRKQLFPQNILNRILECGEVVIIFCFGNFQIKDKKLRRGQNPDNVLTTFDNDHEVLLVSLFQIKEHRRGLVFVWIFVSLRTYAV